MRREVPDALVPPVVGQPSLQQEVVRYVLVHRQQLHRGHAEAGQVLDRGLMPQPGVAAAQLLRYRRMPHREPLDVHLVEDGLRVVAPRWRVVPPVERLVDRQAERHVPRRIKRARRVLVGQVVVVHLGPERDLPAHRPRVRVEQELRRVAPHPAPRGPGPVYSVPIRLPGPGSRHEPMPDPVVVIRQPDPRFRAAPVEQADLHGLGHPRRHRKVDPAVAHRRPQWRGPPPNRIRHAPYVTHSTPAPHAPPLHYRRPRHAPPPRLPACTSPSAPASPGAHLTLPSDPIRTSPSAPGISGPTALASRF